MEMSIVCRACLSTISLEYIDLETPLYDDFTFLECFNYCTKLEANLEDELPNNICVSCGRSLQIAYDFLKASSDADRVLRDSLPFFADVLNLEGSKNAVYDFDAIIKKEDNDDLDYPTEYIEEIENLNVDEIKEEVTEEFPKFEVVISNEEVTAEDANDMWLSSDEDSNWPVLRLDEDSDRAASTETVECKICMEMIAKEEYNSHIKTHTDNKAYKCDECDEKFFSEKSMEMHKKTRHKSFERRGNYICGWCGEAFDCRSKLSQHRLIDHKGKAPNSCLTCGEHFSDEANLRKHVKKSHGIPKKAVNCPYCNKEFKSIAQHIKLNHPDILRIPLPDDGSGVKLSKNQCPYCFRHCQSKGILKDHINTHTGERPYSCSICGKTFHKKTICERHEFAVHQSKDLPKQKCDICDFSTSNILSLRSHMHRHRRPVEKNYLCSFCPMKFVNPKKLYMHEDFKHGTGESAYKCDICQKKFTIKRKLREHKLCVHVSGRPYECPECSKTFKNDFQLKAHQKLHNSRQIDCSLCDKKFARHVDLKIHMRTHTGELPYGCHLCDKRFPIKVRLTYHLQKHMGFKHKCQHCTSEFNSKSKLRLHMFKHIGMPYVCDLCQNGYPNRIGLRRHAKSAHKIILTAEDLVENRRKNVKNIHSEIVADLLPINVSTQDTELEI